MAESPTSIFEFKDEVQEDSIQTVTNLLGSTGNMSFQQTFMTATTNTMRTYQRKRPPISHPKPKSKAINLSYSPNPTMTIVTAKASPSKRKKKPSASSDEDYDVLEDVGAFKVPHSQYKKAPKRVRSLLDLRKSEPPAKRRRANKSSLDNDSFPKQKLGGKSEVQVITIDDSDSDEESTQNGAAVEEEEEESQPDSDVIIAAPPSPTKSHYKRSTMSIYASGICIGDLVVRASISETKESEGIRVSFFASAITFLAVQPIKIDYTSVKKWFYYSKNKQLSCKPNNIAEIRPDGAESSLGNNSIDEYMTFFFPHDIQTALEYLATFRAYFEIVFLDQQESHTSIHDDLDKIHKFYQEKIEPPKKIKKPETRTSTRIQTRASKQRAKRVVFDENRIILTWPPPPARDSVTLVESDMARLAPEEFLNDSIIDFYLKYLQQRVLEPSQTEQFYFFNSFFYRKISEAGLKSESVLKWTGSVDIFEKNYLVIPINEAMHWILAIVCFAKESITGDSSDRVNFRSGILFFDSLNNTLTSTASRAIREYLTTAYLAQNSDSDFKFTAKNLPARKPKVPQQSNGSDCGVFLLHFTEKFCSEPRWDVKSLNTEWFPETEIVEKRENIKSTILRLQAEHQATTDPDPDPESNEILSSESDLVITNEDETTTHDENNNNNEETNDNGDDDITTFSSTNNNNDNEEDEMVMMEPKGDIEMKDIEAYNSDNEEDTENQTS